MIRICQWGRIRAKLRPERLRIKNLPSTDSGFFLAAGARQQRHQVFLVGQAHPVPLQRFDHALVRALAGPQHQQQRSDEHTVNLDLHPCRRFGQPVPAVEDRFDPFEKEFDLPALPVNEADQLGRQILPRGDQMKDIPVGLHPHHPQDGAVAVDAQTDLRSHTTPACRSSSVRGRSGPTGSSTRLL